MTTDWSSGANTAASTPAPVSRDAAVLRSAAGRLREHVDERWVEVADLVFSRVFTATRPSRPLHAVASGGPFHVTEQVVVSYLRASIDQVADCEVRRITVQTRSPDPDGSQGSGAEVCTGVLVELAVRYGTVLIPLADTVRRVASERIAQLLGSVASEVSVAAMHVHLADVTVGDPKVGADRHER